MWCFNQRQMPRCYPYYIFQVWQSKRVSIIKHWWSSSSSGSDPWLRGGARSSHRILGLSWSPRAPTSTPCSTAWSCAASRACSSPAAIAERSANAADDANANADAASSCRLPSSLTLRLGRADSPKVCSSVMNMLDIADRYILCRLATSVAKLDPLSRRVGSWSREASGFATAKPGTYSRTRCLTSSYYCVEEVSCSGSVFLSKLLMKIIWGYCQSMVCAETL